MDKVKRQSNRIAKGDWICVWCKNVFRTRREMHNHKKEKHPEYCDVRWRKGLTKDTCESLRLAGIKTHNNYLNGMKPSFLGKHHTEETKKRISIGQKKAHAEGRTNSWIGRRKKSYAEQSWYNIFVNELGNGSFENNYFVKECHYWLDFAWPKKKLYFEVDGKTHFTNEGIEKDKIRTERLANAGWKLIGRCKWSDYQKLSFEEKEKFVHQIISKVI